jgi:hypothetical protein
LRSSYCCSPAPPAILFSIHIHDLPPPGASIEERRYSTDAKKPNAQGGGFIGGSTAGVGALIGLR